MRETTIRKSWLLKWPTAGGRGTTNSLIGRLLEPKSINDDEKRQEFILNILLLGSVLLSAVALLIVLVEFFQLGEGYEGAPIWILIATFGIFLGLYLLSRFRFYKAAAYIFIFLYFAVGTYTLLTWGTLVAQGWLVYVLVITMAGILISTKFAFVATTSISAALITITYLHEHNIVPPNLYWIQDAGGFDDAITFIFTLAVITLIIWLSNREIERSLIRARKSEAELKRERDSLEVKIEQRTKQLKQIQMEKVAQLYRFADLGKLTSGMLHDLINPLTSVSLNLEQAGAKRSSELIKQALEGTRRMRQFVEAARKQIQYQKYLKKFSLNQEIEQVMLVLNYKARQARVDIDFEQGRKITTFGDPIKFNQVATNLVSNAIDAYQGKKKNNARKIFIGLKQVNREIIMIVKDWGRGITPSEINKIFEPFYSTKSVNEGMGIGLSITKDIIEKEFLGKIKVTSGPELGTVFTVILPAKK